MAGNRESLEKDNTSRVFSWGTAANVSFACSVGWKYMRETGLNPVAPFKKGPGSGELEGAEVVSIAAANREPGPRRARRHDDRVTDMVLDDSGLIWGCSLEGRN